MCRFRARFNGKQPYKAPCPDDYGYGVAYIKHIERVVTLLPQAHSRLEPDLHLAGSAHAA